jgi:hypothetical protein
MKEIRKDVLFDFAIVLLCVLMALLLTACGGIHEVTTVSPATAAPGTTVSAPSVPKTTTPETTALMATVPSRPGVAEYFSDRGSWQNLAVLAINEDGIVRPQYLFQKAFSGEKAKLTEQERQLLPQIASQLDTYKNRELLRYNRQQIDKVLLYCYGKDADELSLDLTSAFTYLPETGCYYTTTSGSAWNRIDFGFTEERSDGTIAMYYDVPADPARDWGRVAILQPHETGYYIISNGRYYDNSGKTEEQIAFETMFRDPNDWHSRALTCHYQDPSELHLQSIFYCGFDDEGQKPTADEWELLKDKPGFNENYDLIRLPAARMDAILKQYFGISLAQIPESGKSGLVYLPSTDCYYFMATGWYGVESFLAENITHMDDGTIRLEYSLRDPDEFYVVTMVKEDMGYRFLSNVPLEEALSPSPKTADSGNLVAAAAAMGISFAGTALLALGGDLFRSIRKRKT